MKTTFEEKINHLFEKHLEPMVKNSNLEDGRYFQTAMFKMREEMGKKVEKVTPQQAGEFIIDLLKSMQEIDVDEMLENAAAQNTELECQLKDESELASAFIDLILVK